MLWRFASSGSAWHVAQVRGRFRWYVGARGSDFARRPWAAPWHDRQVAASESPRPRDVPWMLSRYWRTWAAWHVAHVSIESAAAGRTSCVPWHAVHVGAGARACARRLPWAPPASPPGTAAWQSAQRTRGSRSWGAVAVVWHARQSSPPCADPFSAAPSTKSETGRPGRGVSRLRSRSAWQARQSSAVGFSAAHAAGAAEKPTAED